MAHAFRECPERLQDDLGYIKAPPISLRIAGGPAPAHGSLFLQVVTNPGLTLE